MSLRKYPKCPPAFLAAHRADSRTSADPRHRPESQTKEKISTQRSRSPHRSHRACCVSPLRPQEFCFVRSVFSHFRTRRSTDGMWQTVCAKAHVRLLSSFEANKKRNSTGKSTKIYEKMRFEATKLLKTNKVDLERTQIRTQFQVERTQL